MPGHYHSMPGYYHLVCPDLVGVTPGKALCPVSSSAPTVGGDDEGIWPRWQDPHPGTEL